ncbi:hypothetical protein LCM10_04425 [Rossellomorea aquimaris]|uniref:hypothetical protein n=1 Tax=Rossellomorea aquimaris TaxID=189382 RepID=UPI001CD62E72|nr:hypothetical protein [Rossellomorea aquimaris]MCA1054223.1 hypothetical protein [Rossellomorea aquimaris]
MSKREISFTRIDLDQLSSKEQSRYKRKLTLFHYFSKLTKKAPILVEFGDSATYTTIMAIRKEFFKGKAIVFNRVFGDRWGIEVYYDIVENQVQKPKELMINDTTYVYDMINIDIGIKGYGATEYKGELE